MVSVFLDTSAIFAILDRKDEQHERAGAVLTSLRESNQELLTTNYVLVEAIALVQRRLGTEALRDLQDRIVPISSVLCVDSVLHERAIARLMAAQRRHLSLVDCASFEAMRQAGIDTAFSFDRHFAEQGFHLIPQV